MARANFLFMFNLVFPSTPMVFSAKLTIPKQVVLPQAQDFTVSFAELPEVPVSPFLQPVHIPLDGPSDVSGTPPSFVSSTDSLKVYSATSPRSLMKRLDKIRLSTDHWGTPPDCSTDHLPLGLPIQTV